MLYILLIIIHIIVCLVLISVILLQAGRGGGLTDMMGGGDSAQSLLGTQAPVLLKKATEICAIAFLVTSLLLGMVTSRRGRSLFDKMKLPAGLPVQGAESVPGSVADSPVTAEGVQQQAQAAAGVDAAKSLSGAKQEIDNK